MTTNVLKLRKTKNSYNYDSSKNYKSVASSKTAHKSYIKTTTVEIDGSILNKVLMYFLGFLLLASIIIILGITVNYVNKYITTSEKFTITNINVQGVTRIKEEELLSLAGIKLGTNIFSVDLHTIEQNLLTSPWIENVAIKRVIPNSFEITITERLPQFWVLQDGKLHYLDEQGRLIAPVGTDNFISLPTLDIGPGGEDVLLGLTDFMNELKINKLPFELEDISWIRVSAAKGFELFFEQKNLNISIDNANIQKNMDYLNIVIEDLVKRNELSQIKELRVADSQVWLLRHRTL